MKDIRRVFMYHGAEHKTISCFERGLPMTPANAKTCSRIHDRCGTTFLFLVVFISIIVYCFVNWLFADVYFGIGNDVARIHRAVSDKAAVPAPSSRAFPTKC